MKNPSGGGKGSAGGGSNNLPKQPKPFPENLRMKKDLRRDTPERLAADIEAINPRWNEKNPDPNLRPQWNINCTRCAAAVEMRARGYDVTAMPKPVNVKDNQTPQSAAKFRDKNGNIRNFEEVTAPKEYIRDFLEERLLEYGEGARGYIRANWAQGGGHIWNWEIRNGRVQFIDGQPNKPDRDWDDWVPLVADGYSHRVMWLRTDDLTPHEDIMKWVRPRTDAEINAPLYNEMEAELDRRGYPLDDFRRNAFRAGWHAIRTNQTPAPDVFEYDPEVLQAFWDGVEWARRPD
ncbi:VIP2-like toxin [Mycobacterium phage Bud]|nr:VIP2-like toxin [Mycobacterium phage Bud]